MWATAEDIDGLEQVYELNRIFLNFLYERSRARQDCLGLPSEAVAILRRTDPESLERLAEFPRALFTLRVHAFAARDGVLTAGSVDSRATQALHLAVLVSVRNLCRRRSYRAKAFVGLTAEGIHHLRSISLSDLVDLALCPGLVACAFQHSSWLWRCLLTAKSDSARQRLMLVALQPHSSDVGPAYHSSGSD